MIVPNSVETAPPPQYIHSTQISVGAVVVYHPLSGTVTYPPAGGMVTMEYGP